MVVTFGVFGQKTGAVNQAKAEQDPGLFGDLADRLKEDDVRVDAVYRVDEVRDIRDKAIALEAYARRAKNVEAERRACEVRLRAERKAGKLSAKLPKSKGGPASRTLPGVSCSPPQGPQDHSMRGKG